jgi:hypothetical protein
LAAGNAAQPVPPDKAGVDKPPPRFDEAAYMRQIQQILCDEKVIETGP